MEAESDAAAGLLQARVLLAHQPAPAKRPLVEPQHGRHRVIEGAARTLPARQPGEMAVCGHGTASGPDRVARATEAALEDLRDQLRALRG